jgi:hypothetical protein
MANFVNITGSPDDIIATATLISGAGEALRNDMGGLISAIQALDTPAVIGGDEFATEFRKSYEQPTPQEAPIGKANAVTLDAGKSIGEQATSIGDAASKAMADYLVQDGLGAADIAAVPAQAGHVVRASRVAE